MSESIFRLREELQRQSAKPHGPKVDDVMGCKNAGDPVTRLDNLVIVHGEINLEALAEVLK